MGHLLRARQRESWLHAPRVRSHALTRSRLRAQASEWQGVAEEAMKAALILVVLDLLRITRDRPWFDEHGARSQRALLVKPAADAHAARS